MTNPLSVLDRLQTARENLRAASREPLEGRTHNSETNAAPDKVDFAILADFVLRVSELARAAGQDFARFESELALLSDADLWDPRADRVSLLTLHASKGLEFPVVFIVGCEDGLLPLRFGSTDDAASLDEERRLLFVGMTRARERLFLSHARKRLWRGQVRAQTVSPFISAIELALLERSKMPAFKPQEKPVGEQLSLFR